MLSNDFNTIEINAWFIAMSIGLPIKVIGITLILIYRLGWMALVFIFINALFVVMQILLGKLEAKYKVEANVWKDKRIKVYTELLEGMRVLKIYGWELALKQIIQSIRQNEVASYIKLKIAKSLDRTTFEFSAYASGFMCFLIIFLTGNDSHLSSAIILAALQPIILLNEYLKYLGSSITTMFQI